MVVTMVTGGEGEEVAVGFWPFDTKYDEHDRTYITLWTKIALRIAKI